MGAELVGLVLARWTHVSDRAFRVLVRMAHTALDKPSKGRPAAVYRGGRDLLAMSLRGEKGTHDTQYRAVKRAVAELIQAGAIKHLQTGWAGQNAVYRLTLDGTRAIDQHLVDNSSGTARMGGPTSPPKGGQISPPMGGRSGSERGVPETPPRNQEETQDEREEEEGVEVVTTSHAPRARATEPKTEPKPVVVEIFPGAQQEAPYRPARRWSTRGQDAVAEAMTRREAARRAHHEREAT